MQLRTKTPEKQAEVSKTQKEKGRPDESGPLISSMQPLLQGAQGQVGRLLDAAQNRGGSVGAADRARGIATSLPTFATAAATSLRDRVPVERGDSALSLSLRRKRRSRWPVAAGIAGAALAGFAAGVVLGRMLAPPASPEVVDEYGADRVRQDEGGVSA